MKPVTLLFSTALASMMLLAPSIVPSADAAGIKIKPQIVKVRPKIAIAKSKVRVKIRAARVRVAPKIKVNTAKLKPRIKIKKIKPKLLAKVKVQPNKLAKIHVKPRIKPNKPAAGGLKLRAQAAAKLAKIGKQARFKHAANAARAAAAAKDAISLSAIRTAASPELALKTPDLASTVPTNIDLLDGMNKKPDNSSTRLRNPDKLWSQSQAARFGPDSFGGIADSHSQGPANSQGTSASDAAKGFMGVTSDTIAGAVAGVAGQRDGRGSAFVDGRSVHNESDGNVVTSTVKYRTGNVNFEKYVAVESSSDSDRAVGFIVTRTFDGTSTGDGIIGTTSIRDRNGNERPAGPAVVYEEPADAGSGATELRDPDSGYAGPSPLPWIDEKPTTDLSMTSNSNSPGALPAGPDQAEPNGHSNIAAQYTANDVLERHDEDGRNRGERTIIDRDRMQSD
jgi:hypothetical protein